MAYNKKSAKKIQKLVEKVGVVQASVEMGISPESVGRALRMARQPLVPKTETNASTPPSVGCNAPVLVIPDLHAPYHHPDTIEFLKWVQEWRGCRERVVSVGDLYDFHSMSRFISEVDAPNAKLEYQRAKEFVDELIEAFPCGDLVLGNHDLIPQRQMKEMGLLTELLKGDNDLYNLPDTWNIHPFYHVVEPDSWDVLVEHGIGSGGKYGCANTSKEKSCSYVQGHTHSAAAVIYRTTHAGTTFGMNVGSCVDSSSLAMRYGKYGTRKGVTSCGVIYNSSHAEVVTMETWEAQR